MRSKRMFKYEWGTGRLSVANIREGACASRW